MRRPNKTDVLAYIWYDLRTTICVEVYHVMSTMDMRWTSVGRLVVHWVDNSVREVTFDEVFDFLILSVFLLNFNLCIRLIFRSLFDVGLFIVTSAILTFTMMHGYLVFYKSFEEFCGGPLRLGNN